MKYNPHIWLSVLILALTVAPAASPFACPCPPDCTHCSAAEHAPDQHGDSHSSCVTDPAHLSCCAVPVVAHDADACLSAAPEENDTTCFCSPYSKPHTLATANLNGAFPRPTFWAALPCAALAPCPAADPVILGAAETHGHDKTPAHLKNCVFLC